MLGIHRLLRLSTRHSFIAMQRIPGADGAEISSVAWARAPGDLTGACLPPHWMAAS